MSQNNFVKAFSFLAHNAGATTDKVISTLLLAGESLLVAVVIAVPLGIYLGHIHRFSFLAINISNLGRALPSVAVLAILLPYVGIGRTDVIIALVVLAVPPILTNTYVAVDGVEAELVDAAKGIGLRARQVLTKVELPLALPLIFAGIRTSAVFVVATATLGGIFGGGGLGDIINNQESFGLDGVIGASYVLIVLAFLVQGVFIVLERLVTPAGLKVNRTRNSRLGRATPWSGSGGADRNDPGVDLEEGPGEDSLASVGATGNYRQQGRSTT